MKSRPTTFIFFIGIVACLLFDSQEGMSQYDGVVVAHYGMPAPEPTKTENGLKTVFKIRERRSLNGETVSTDTVLWQYFDAQGFLVREDRLTDFRRSTTFSYEGGRLMERRTMLYTYPDGLITYSYGKTDKDFSTYFYDYEGNLNRHTRSVNLGNGKTQFINVQGENDTTSVSITELDETGQKVRITSKMRQRGASEFSKTIEETFRYPSEDLIIQTCTPYCHVSGPGSPDSLVTKRIDRFTTETTSYQKGEFVQKKVIVTDKKGRQVEYYAYREDPDKFDTHRTTTYGKGFETTETRSAVGVVIMSETIRYDKSGLTLSHETFRKISGTSELMTYHYSYY